MQSRCPARLRREQQRSWRVRDAHALPEHRVLQRPQMLPRGDWDRRTPWSLPWHPAWAAQGPATRSGAFEPSDQSTAAATPDCRAVPLPRAWISCESNVHIDVSIGSSFRTLCQLFFGRRARCGSCCGPQPGACRRPGHRGSGSRAGRRHGSSAPGARACLHGEQLLDLRSSSSMCASASAFTCGSGGAVLPQVEQLADLARSRSRGRASGG